VRTASSNSIYGRIGNTVDHRFVRNRRLKLTAKGLRMLPLEDSFFALDIVEEE
jgi:hypothetical protein